MDEIIFLYTCISTSYKLQSNSNDNLFFNKAHVSLKGQTRMRCKPNVSETYDFEKTTKCDIQLIVQYAKSFDSHINFNGVLQYSVSNMWFGKVDCKALVTYY